MTISTQAQLLAKFETLFKEKGRPEQLDESFIDELFIDIPVELNGEIINNIPSRLVRTQAIFGGSVSPPALEKFIVPGERKEYVVAPTISLEHSPKLVIETSAQVFGVLKGAAKYKINIVRLEDNSVLGYFEVFNRESLLRVAYM
ncbi:hypothetical protein Clacol_009589 [Clathrus columnatus]|uniref:Uncharacterized protein n=1 Tax=Clathrus columnatus TaxID=1419009 RepID=A0AAV5ARK2_9AGAM|nr:hypothetical protein Clacol_009589 [Clathrus columnatus]